MKIGDTIIDDTFAEAFRMVYTRLIITAADAYWRDIAVASVCGYGTSVIGCDAEVGCEMLLDASTTIDGRPGAAVMLFGFSADRLEQAVVNRVAQAVMTCPSTAVFNGLETALETRRLGDQLRFFGDGFQKSKVVADRRFWRIPVMDGEFLVEATFGIDKGVAGGNFLIQACDEAAGLAAARRAVGAIAAVPEVITPFPGGVVRSGSKVGSKYSGLKASTNHEYCPNLRTLVASKLAAGAQAVYEIVINGTGEPAIASAMQVGIRASVGPQIVAVSAGNYGGKLGKFHFHLHQILGNSS